MNALADVYQERYGVLSIHTQCDGKSLVPNYINGYDLWLLWLNLTASEQNSHECMAMQNATDSATKMLDAAYNITYNRVRQADDHTGD